MPEFLVLPSIVGCFILLDIATGIIQAIANKDLSSEKLRKGAFHKMSFVLIICLAYLIDYGVGYIDLGFNFPIVVPTCTYICLTEIISIVENIIKINPELKDSKVLSIFFKNDNVQTKEPELIDDEDLETAR